MLVLMRSRWSPRQLLVLLLLLPAFGAAQAQEAVPEAQVEAQAGAVDAVPAAGADENPEPGEQVTEEDFSDELESIRAAMQELDTRVEELRILSGGIDGTPSIDQQALVFRRDERSVAVLAEADKIARQIAELPEDLSQRAELEDDLTETVSDVPASVAPRLRELDAAIVEQRGKLPGSSGLDRITTETYIQGLQQARYGYLEAMVNHLETRELLGLPVQGLRQTFEDFFYLQAEGVSGALQFIDQARSGLKGRLSADPGNADLAAAVQRLNEEHQFQIETLGKLVGLMERLELDATTYKSLLVQGGPVSVRMIEKGVLRQLLAQWYDGVKQFLIDRSPDFAFRALIFILVLLIFRSLSRLIRRLVRAGCDRSSLDLSQLLKDTLVSFSGGTVMLVGILMALSQLGISIGPMLAGLGIAGFIVGFAMQDTLANFAAGGMILIYRPYDVDDFVDVAGATGMVKKMNLVSTTITTPDNQTMVVPNSKIWGDVIKNVTAQKVRRVDLEFGIGYEDDIAHAEQVLSAVAADHELVLKTPETMVRVHCLADSSVNLILRPWVKTEDYWTVYWDLTREVKMRFDQEGISIPFPQRDVHLYRKAESEA